MIKPRYCACGAELNKYNAKQCKRCALKERYVLQGIDWKPEEETILVAYVVECEKINSLVKELAETRSKAREFRKSLIKRHNSNAISAKRIQMKRNGRIKNMPHNWIRTEVKSK